ncbi:MAG: UDP-3-O-(3-hydroxymyristoyl)glucosamine N-acyltransferase [Chlamydiales bacterium]|nr:UDP-3-O-(3-hydroxymyristoyl)glucosamine N-acyltransferase [Chlamydiales bacterium]
MSKSVLLQELAKLTGAILKGNPSAVICAVDGLETATEKDASFLANMRYFEAMKASKAGVICIADHPNLPTDKNFLISEDPSRTFQQIAEYLSKACTSGFMGIHPSACIHPDALIADEVTIGPFAVIDRGAIIGKHTTICAHVSIGADVQIGENCLLHPQSTVREGCILGNRVILQPGAVIGSCGYGYVMDAQGHHKKLDQIGNVVLEDDVEIGANTTIDRARFKSTRIGQGTKIDNLVQIGHNVDLGKHNLIISQSGIAGSAKTGSHVFMGGQAGIVGHITITDNVQIATRGGVSKDITESGIYGGGPVMPMKDFNIMQVHIRKIASYAKRLQALEKRLNEILSS